MKKIFVMFVAVIMGAIGSGVCANAEELGDDFDLFEMIRSDIIEYNKFAVWSYHNTAAGSYGMTTKDGTYIGFVVMKDGKVVEINSSEEMCSLYEKLSRNDSIYTAQGYEQ